MSLLALEFLGIPVTLQTYLGLALVLAGLGIGYLKLLPHPPKSERMEPGPRRAQRTPPAEEEPKFAPLDEAAMEEEGASPEAEEYSDEAFEALRAKAGVKRGKILAQAVQETPVMTTSIETLPEQKQEMPTINLDEQMAKELEERLMHKLQEKQARQLSPKEQSTIEHLAKLLAPKKEFFSMHEIKQIMKEEGYPEKIIEAVVKKLFGGAVEK